MKKPKKEIRRLEQEAAAARLALSQAEQAYIEDRERGRLVTGGDLDRMLELRAAWQGAERRVAEAREELRRLEAAGAGPMAVCA